MLRVMCGSKQREIYFVVHVNLSKLANQAKARQDAFPIRIYQWFSLIMDV